MTRGAWVVVVASVGAGIALVVVVAALVLFGSETDKPVASELGTVVRVGGLDYRAPDVRLLDPADAGDARLIRRLAPVRPDQAWLGVFVTATNPAQRSLPMAERFVLRDQRNRGRPPVPLPPGEPFAYRPEMVAPGSVSPGTATRAQRDLAAEGGLLLFRVPRAAYDDGTLELRIADPVERGSSGDLILSS